MIIVSPGLCPKLRGMTWIPGSGYERSSGLVRVIDRPDVGFVCLQTLLYYVYITCKYFDGLCDASP